MTVQERLRALADWFEKHPNAPLPYELREGNKFIVAVEKNSLKEVIQNIGSFEKVYDDSFLNMIVKVADFKIEYYTNRGNICTQKVVAKKLVPETVEPSYYVPEKIIPAHEEDVIEWECPEALLEALGEKGETSGK